MKTLINELRRVFHNSLLPIIVLAAVLGMALCATNMLGQSGAGSIQGTVTDATGAALPGASIHVVNKSTGVATTSKSDKVGFYQVPTLFTGTYDVTFIAQGFKSYNTSIDLLVGQNAVINPILTPGTVAQQITVFGNDIQLVTTNSGTISSTLENQRINQLPENGRILTNLVGMSTPGLEDSGQAANGLPPESIEYVADGATAVNRLLGGEDNNKIEIPDPDAIQEVKVETTDSGAELALPSTVILTTKSGTNALHGTFFETSRNNSLGIAKTRANPANYSAPELVRNEFGASAGGPILLPHVYHGKDKSFWFFAYERYSNAAPTYVEEKVPTLAMRLGDFSGLINSSGILQTLFDPSTTAMSTSCAYTGGSNNYCRTPFPNNQILTTEESPAAKVFYALAPTPTTNANPLVQDNLNALRATFQIIPQVTFRLDHTFDDNNRVYLRYTDELSNPDRSGVETNVAADGIAAGAATGYYDTVAGSFVTALGYTHIFSPTFFAETLASQQWWSIDYLSGVDTNIDYESMLGLPNNFGETGFPEIGNSDLIESFNGSQTTADPFVRQIITDIDENLTKIVGRQEIHFGARYRHERLSIIPKQSTDTITPGLDATAIYNPSSGSNYTAESNTGNYDASFFLGSANSYQVTLPRPYEHLAQMELDGYLQDDYHMAKTLTFNLGLRYEAHPGIWTKYGIANSFDLKNDAMVLSAPPSTLIAEGYTTLAIITNDENIGVKFETPAEAGMPAKLYRNYYLNFLPRLGLAYQLFGGKYGTVVRAGYGRYDYPVPLTDGMTTSPTNNPLTASYTQSYTTAAQAIDGSPNELLRYNAPAEFGVMGENTANVVNTAATNSILPGVTLQSVAPNWAPAVDTEVNVTVEQPIIGNSALRVSWVWTHGTNLDTEYAYNNHPSTYQWEMTYGTVPPTGGSSVIGTAQQNTYSTTATGPYDQTTWGSGSYIIPHEGWSNDNNLQINYEHLFHHGFAYQVYYVLSKPMHMGGDDSVTIDPAANYPGVLGTVATMTPSYGTVYPGLAPPRVPTGAPAWAEYHALDRFEAYNLDNSTTPIQHLAGNFIVNLPVGRGQRFLGGANRFVNELVGGFQLAGDVNLLSQMFQPIATFWGPTSPIHVYKHKVPITDCRSGVCEKEFLWFNGYLAPTVTTGVAGSTCTTNCVYGLPADYTPFQTPVDNTPGTTYYGDNEVQITAPTLNSGKALSIAYDAGPQGSNYTSHTWLNGPINWTMDSSIFKVFPITEKVVLRFNMDVFNVLNEQGYNNPSATDGTENMLSSYNLPRQIQLSLRLTF